jgi:exodeoxyribonuclease V alpha subunit
MSTEGEGSLEPEIQFAPEQTEAINLSCDPKNRLVSITGPAGCGKTTILKKIYELLTEAGYTVALCSPTGKAAKRIYEATGIPALTIHRLLEYTHPGEVDPDTGKVIGLAYPRRDRNKPLDFDFVLGDEYAMVPDELHNNLLAAIKPGGCVRLFGDDNQLRPIEENKHPDAPPEDSPFVKCLKNPKLASITLKTVFRQGKDSGILANLHQILKKRTPVNNDQWSNKFTDQPVQELQRYIEDCTFSDNPQDLVDFRSPNNQIIVPQNSSWVGTIKLNFMIQALFYAPSDPGLIIPRHEYELKKWQREKITRTQIKLHVGDKVLVKANNYELGIFNGETGVITEFNTEFGDFVIDFGDREQTIPPVQVVVNKWGKESTIDPRKDIDLAYAITTHKSQGSQYDTVVYVMNKSNTYMLNNRNMYTACSRAKKFVKIFTDQDSFSRTVYKAG